MFLSRPVQTCIGGFNGCLRHRERARVSSRRSLGSFTWPCRDGADSRPKFASSKLVESTSHDSRLLKITGATWLSEPEARLLTLPTIWGIYLPPEIGPARYDAPHMSPSK